MTWLEELMRRMGFRWEEVVALGDCSGVAHLTRTHIEVDGASHWGLVLNRRVLSDFVSAVVDWISKATA